MERSASSNGLKRSSSSHQHLASRRSTEDAGIGTRKKSKVGISAMTAQHHHGRDGPRSHAPRRSTGEIVLAATTQLTSAAVANAAKKKVQNVSDGGENLIIPVKKRQNTAGSRSGRRKVVLSDEGETFEAPVPTKLSTDDDVNDSWVSESETSAANSPVHSPKFAKTELPLFSPRHDAETKPTEDLYGVTPKATPEKLKSRTESPQNVKSDLSRENGELKSPTAAAATPRPPSYLSSPRPDSPETNRSTPKDPERRQSEQTPDLNSKNPNTNAETDDGDPLPLPRPTGRRDASLSSRSLRSLSSATRSGRSSGRILPLAALTPKINQTPTALAPQLDASIGWGEHAPIDSPVEERSDPIAPSEQRHQRNISNLSTRSNTTLSTGTASDLTRRLREASSGGVQERRRATSGLTATQSEGAGYFDSIGRMLSSSNLAGLVTSHKENEREQAPSVIYNALKKISPAALTNGPGNNKNGKRTAPVISKFTTFEGSPQTPTFNRWASNDHLEMFSPTAVATPHTHAGSDEICSEHHLPGLLRPPLSQSHASLHGQDFDESLDEDKRRRDIQNWAFAIVFEAQRVAKVHEHARIWHDPIKDSFARISAERARKQSNL